MGVERFKKADGQLLGAPELLASGHAP